MAVAADEERGPCDLLRVSRFDDIHHVKAAEGREALLPRHARALLADARGHVRCHFPELLRVLKCVGRDFAQNHIGRHAAPPRVLSHLGWSSAILSYAAGLATCGIVA